MFEIKGSAHKMSATDYFQRCRNCGRGFYFSRDCNGKTVKCPHCGQRH